MLPVTLRGTYMLEHEPLIGDTLGDASKEEQRDPKPWLHVVDPSSGFQIAKQGVCYHCDTSVIKVHTSGDLGWRPAQ